MVAAWWIARTVVTLAVGAVIGGVAVIVHDTVVYVKELS